MFLRLIHLSLRPGERLVKVVRQSKIRIIFPLLLSFSIYLLAFFFLFYFISLGKLGMIFFGFLLFIASFYAFYKFYFWYFNVLILTNKRVIDIDQRKFFERIISDVSYGQIRDVVVKVKGVFQTIFCLGAIFLVSKGENDNLELANISRPEKIRDLILKLRADEAENPPYSSFIKGGDGGGFKNEKMKQIFEEIRHLDDETLGRILARLPEIIKEESERSFFALPTDKHKYEHK